MLKINSLLLVCVFSLWACNSKQPSSKVNNEEIKLPNVLLLMADDMGYGDPHCYNPDSKISTPHMDRLAEEGLRFTDAHAAGSWCVPSRYGLLTGTYPCRTKMNWAERALLGKEQATLATLFKENGYATACVGKWHLGFDKVSASQNATKNQTKEGKLAEHGLDNTGTWQYLDENTLIRGGPTDHGFDYFYGIPASLDIPPYFYIENSHCVKPPTHTIADNQTEGATTSIQGAFWRGGGIAPGFKHEEVLANFQEKTLAFLEEESQTSHPFFLYLALAAPHTPWLPNEQFQGKSPAGQYGDFVMQVDAVLGAVLKKLDELEIAEETLVIFTSDNGPVWYEPDRRKFKHRSTALLRGMKTDAWEGGHRMPFLVRWPGKVPASKESNALIGFTDVFATLAEIVGYEDENNDSRDSYSFLSILNDPSSPGKRRELLVGENANMLRLGSWKLIEGSGLGVVHKQFSPVPISEEVIQQEGELYNLKDDLSETNNLYSEMTDKVAELRQLRQRVLNHPKKK